MAFATYMYMRFVAIASSIGLSALGAGIGQGLATQGALGAMMRQQLGNNHIYRMMVVGLAFIESCAVLTLVISIVMLFTSSGAHTIPIGLAEVGIGLAMGIASCSAAIASSFAVISSAHAIARQPFFSQRIITLMVIVQTLIETSVIFAFVVALIIRAQIVATMGLPDGLRYVAAGLAIGLGSVGPSIGHAIFAYACCRAIGMNKHAYAQIFSFTLLSEAIIEAPLIFSLVVAVVLLFKPFTLSSAYTDAIAFVVGALTVGIGAGSASVGTGMVASRSITQIALNPLIYGAITRTALLAQAIIESTGIYSLIVSLLIITVA
jgi:F-type H+-transporting ATPase subunit c